MMFDDDELQRIFGEGPDLALEDTPSDPRLSTAMRCVKIYSNADQKEAASEWLAQYGVPPDTAPEGVDSGAWWSEEDNAEVLLDSLTGVGVSSCNEVCVVTGPLLARALFF